MYTCRDAAEQLTEDREGALTGWTRVWHRFHMKVCPHCRAYRRQMDRAVGLAREVPRTEVSAEVLSSAMEAFRRRGKL